MAAVIVLTPIIARQSSFYASLVSKKHDTFPPESAVNAKLKNRHEMLDGLRGFLALGVLFQHAVTNFAYFSTGVWKITDVRFYRHAGGEAVILFFMITSFLYWSKTIASKGNVDARKVYVNRFLRLAPMYLFSAAIVTLSILVQTDFQIASATGFIKDIFSWLSLGLVTTTTMNGLSVIPNNAGIHWTLHYEWMFYLLLPFSGMVLRGGYYRLFAVPLLLLVFLLPDRGYWVIFLFGILAAHVVHRWPKVKWIHEGENRSDLQIDSNGDGRVAKAGTAEWRTWLISCLPILGLVAIYLIQYKPYGMIQYVISFGMLLLFIYGNSFFGLFRTSAARFLGTISYSVYLMHGIVLFVVLSLAKTIVPIASLTAWCFWGLILIAALVTVLLSAITYRYIEHPFLMKK